eukprot:TRINITY_DN4982_c1_g2_i1.p1 TRINITY_DN4982_c1_g2~~TRINITY_DN4982_c1_g2_i1.p1  ORF type:complete len:103 (-),score=3.55 TRINITY_DN4982_c1_g2_i1:10-318(-)
MGLTAIVYWILEFTAECGELLGIFTLCGIFVLWLGTHYAWCFAIFVKLFTPDRYSAESIEPFFQSKNPWLKGIKHCFVGDPQAVSHSVCVVCVCVWCVLVNG